MLVLHASPVLPDLPTAQAETMAAVRVPWHSGHSGLSGLAALEAAINSKRAPQSWHSYSKMGIGPTHPLQCRG